MDVKESESHNTNPQSSKFFYLEGYFGLKVYVPVCVCVCVLFPRPHVISK